MTVFTAIWYLLMLVWVVGGAGFGTLAFAWVLLVPLLYWLARFQLSGNGTGSIRSTLRGPRHSLLAALASIPAASLIRKLLSC